MKRLVLILILLSFQLAEVAANQDYLENELLLGTSLNDNVATVRQILTAAGSCERFDLIFKDDQCLWWRAHFKFISDPEIMSREIMSRYPGVFAQPNRRIQGALLPDDPFYVNGMQYSLGNGSTLLFPSGIVHTNAQSAWDVTTGRSEVVVAVLDSGLDFDHADLWSQFWSNPLETSNGLDDDGNLLVDDVDGWDFVNDDADPADDNGHGTQVAGVISARGNDASGVAGMTWHCPVMVLKVLDQDLYGSVGSAIEAIQYAIQKGASVINCSFTAASNDPALSSAISAAISAGVVVVGAVGNDAQNIVKYPAAYSNVLSVGALACNGSVANFSNYATDIDLFAPGVSIFQATWMENGARYPWAGSSGTSMACPHVSAAAALLKSAHYGDSEWTNAFIAAQLTHTGAEFIDISGNHRRMLDTAAALTLEPQPDLQSSDPEVTVYLDADGDGRFDPGDLFDYTFSVRNDWAPAASVTAMLISTNPHIVVTNTPQILGPIGFQQVIPVQFRIEADDSATYGETYLLTLQLQDLSGTPQTHDVRITLGPRELSGPAFGIFGPGSSIPAIQYDVIAPLIIPPGNAMMVMPGVRFMFRATTALSVFGELTAIGSAVEPIIFEGAEDAIWDGIRFMPGSVSAVYSSLPPGGIALGGSIFEYCRFTNGNPALACGSEGASGTASPYVHFCSFSSSEMGVKISGSNSTWLDRSAFTGNPYNIRFEDLQNAVSGSPLITNCTTIGDANAGSQNVSAYQISTPYTAAPVIQESNIFGANPLGGFDYYAFVPANPPITSFPSQNNYWGAYTTAQLPFGDTDLIYDSYDIPMLVSVDTSGYLSDYSVFAPACLESIGLTPSGVVPMGDLYVELHYSKPMNESVTVAVSFGTSTPFDQNVFTGSWMSSTMWFGHVTIDEGMAGQGGVQTLRISGMVDIDGMPLPDNTDTTFTIDTAIEGVHGMAVMGKINSIDVSWDDEEEKRSRATYSGHVVEWGTQSGVYTHQRHVPSPATSTTLSVPADIDEGVMYFVGIRYYESENETPPPYSYLGPVYAEGIGETLQESLPVPAFTAVGVLMLMIGLSVVLKKR